MTMEPDDPRHGTANGYNNRGCRCSACRQAWAERHREYMNADPARLELHRQRMADRRSKNAQ